ncbi:hypothetical protein [Saccharicrinis aurantiacus]|uniref:hypothetical protein n=1 Tax=Saccharicrinis aurantiacus TaxID=1849719 RepID=UPI002493234F|nr:hypothetical protein [Saccharicrinis aurantiacus]
MKPLLIGILLSINIFSFSQSSKVLLKNELEADSLFFNSILNKLHKDSAKKTQTIHDTVITASEFNFINNKYTNIGNKDQFKIYYKDNRVLKIQGYIINGYKINFYFYYHNNKRYILYTYYYRAQTDGLPVLGNGYMVNRCDNPYYILLLQFSKDVYIMDNVSSLGLNYNARDIIRTYSLNGNLDTRKIYYWYKGESRAYASSIPILKKGFEKGLGWYSIYGEAANICNFTLEELIFFVHHNGTTDDISYDPIHSIEVQYTKDQYPLWIHDKLYY